jgi:hypothetical protein
MAKEMAYQPTWPRELKENDELYAMVNGDGDVEYLVLSSREKRATYVRDNRTWQRVRENFFDAIEDKLLINEDVPLEFVLIFDSYDTKGLLAPLDAPPITAAAEEADTCPPATQSIEINLRNRRKAITGAGYGPLNPKEPNEAFWQDKADLWSVSIEDAKKSRCRNCAVFTVTTKMKDCIASGLESGGSSSENAWDAIDAAELGYCEAFDFKCAASRTCDAWVTGGPITDETQKSKGADS